ncbi:MAG: Rrf2 family transcriptional regulator [Lachnospiraceae bacterium]|nr:Rrf2 family transcriptional regulator [Robinsoniella sp.]MDY3767692.1 Rrf2 family transcriptional regulator [Lachnospiraceae bacterium]
MQISSRFIVAIYIFACMEMFGREHEITSDFLTSRIKVKPVIIRKTMAQLRKAGLIKVERGTGGTIATRHINEITFYDVYLAVESMEGKDLFHFCGNTNPQYPMGEKVHAALGEKMLNIQQAMEDEMKKYTIADIMGSVRDGIETNEIQNN